MEAVLFRYHACPACGQYDIFVDINLLSGKSKDLLQRRGSLKDAVRGRPDRAAAG